LCGTVIHLSTPAVLQCGRQIPASPFPDSIVYKASALRPLYNIRPPFATFSPIFIQILFTTGKTSRALPSSSCQGDASPWIPIFWGLWGAELQLLPRWYSFRGRSPAYPFFRKEKIQLHRRRRKYDAGSLERVLLRSDFLRGQRCGTHGIPQSGATAWRRWKGSVRGTKSLPAEPVSVVVLRSRLSAAQRVPRTQEGAFFFT
jgi:hypothetical protein